jgi:hypothetical protein
MHLSRPSFWIHDTFFGIVGFIMALYYLVWAAEAVRDTKSGLNHQKRIAELEQEIAKLTQTT